RLGRAPAIEQGLKKLQDPKTALEEREQLSILLGEIREPRSVPILLDIVRGTQPVALKRSALAALQNFKDVKIGVDIAGLYPAFSTGVKEDAEALLSSRKEWARAWLEAVEAGKVSPKSIPDVALKKVLLHRDDRLAS